MADSRRSLIEMAQPPRSVTSRNQPTNAKYKATLDSFMSFVHGREYRQDKEDIVESRKECTNPQCWLNVKTFGIEEPPVDANPVHA